MSITSLRLMRVLAGAFLTLFLVSQVGETFAQRGRGGGGGGGGFGSYNTYRSTGGGYRSSQPAPMTPRYTAAPRQMAPSAAYPRGPSGGGPAGISAPRPLPKSINAGSPVAASPAFTGKVTKVGSPIITVRTGKTFSIPQQGVFGSRTITTFQRFKTQLLATTASGQRVVIKERITQVALGKKTVVEKAGKTVLGHYPNYEFNSASFAARRFSVPKAVWEKMSDDERWEANRKFLDRTIKRGDQIYITTPIERIKPGSYYEREIDYLKKNGYRVSDDGKTLVKK